MDKINLTWKESGKTQNFTENMIFGAENFIKIQKK